MSIQRRFGRRLRARRQALGLTQIELAAKADLHCNYVGDVERGERNPTLGSVDRLARAVDTDAAALLGFSEEWLDAALAELRAALDRPDALEAERADGGEAEAEAQKLRTALTNALQRLRDAAADETDAAG